MAPTTKGSSSNKIPHDDDDDEPHTEESHRMTQRTTTTTTTSSLNSTSTRSSIDSSTSQNFLPETLHESDQAHQRIRSRRLSTTSVASSRLTHVSSRLSRMSSILEAIRDDNELTAQEEQRVADSDIAILQREWTVNDALSRIDTTGPATADAGTADKDEEHGLDQGSGLDDDAAAAAAELSEQQEKIKNAGYTTEDFLDPPPDGGMKAWTNAFCVLLLSFSTWGINSAYGVFLSYYISTDYFPGATSYDYALIGSIVVSLAQFASPLVIIVMKVVGYKESLIIGTILQTSAYILASFSTQIWQLYLTQGVMAAISFAFLFCPATMIIPTWFLRKRGLANGIGMTGAGIGGVVFSLSINKLIDETGDQKWPLRMLAIIGCVICIFCIIVSSPRNYKHPKPTLANTRKVFNAIFDFNAWKQPSTILISIWFGICNMSYTIVLFSISSYGVAIGLTSTQASILTTVLNAGQTFGRPLIGFFADKFGRINFCLGGLLVEIILILAFWINAKSFASMIVFSIVVGMFLSIPNTLNAPIMADSIEPSRFPAAYSALLVSIGIFALPSEVIGMNLRTPENVDFPYLHCQLFTGFLFVAGFILLVPVREIKIRKMVNNRTETTQAKLQRLLKSKQLTTDPQIEDEIYILEKRLDKYAMLSSPGLKGYIARTLYPIKA